MSKKSFTKLLDYIEIVDPDIYEIIEKFCLENLFIPKRGSGLTFLIPTDEKFRNQLKMLSDSEEDADKAVEIISSLIIVDILKTPADVMEKRDDIPNSLGQRIEIDGVKGRSIILKSGTDMIIDERFKDGSKGGKLAVWLLNKGGIPTDGPKATFKYIKKQTSKLKSDEPEEPSENNNKIRRDIANRVENAYIVEMSNQTGKDIYLETTLSLIGYMIKNEYCRELLIEKIIPNLSLDKTDFYILFEPYKTVGPYIISDRILVDWSKDKKSINIKHVIEEINKYLDNSNHIKALMYSNIQGALNEINEKRNKILNSRIAPQSMTKIILQAYDELFKSNILPESLIKYHNSPLHKMCEDEIRFVIYQLFSKLENEYIFDRRRFDDVIERIYDYTNGPDLKPLLLRDVRNQIPSNEKITEIRIFVNSTAFFYIPISFTAMTKYPHEYVLNKPSPRGISSIYNISEILHKRCLKIVETSYNNVIKSKDKDDDIKKLILKMKTEGKLDEFMKSLDV